MNFLLYAVIGLWSSSTVLGEYSRENCGKGISVTKIVYKKNNIINNLTSGYVIHPRAILTVAHPIKDFFLKDLRIMSYQDLESFVRNVSRIYIHPQYNSCNGSHDFAIVTFEDPLPINYTPICLRLKNSMHYLQDNYICITKDYYHSRFYKSSDGSKGECPMILSNFNPQEDIENTHECLLKERGEVTHIIGDRFTGVYICKMSLENEDDYREYYVKHQYFGRLCEKDENDRYISYYGEDSIHSIDSWIIYVISILVEEDDQPLKLSLSIKSLAL